MKIFATIVIFATLAFLATAEGDTSECPEELKTAFHGLKDACKPVFKKLMKGRGGHGGPRRPSNQEDTTDSRKKRQDDGATDFESCLTKIKAEIAFSTIVASCTGEGEEQALCIFREFMKVCPPPRHGPRRDQQSSE